MSKNWDTAIAAYEGALEIEDYNNLEEYMYKNHLENGICFYFQMNDCIKLAHISQSELPTKTMYLCQTYARCNNIVEAHHNIRTRIEFLKFLKSKYPNDPE